LSLVQAILRIVSAPPPSIVLKTTLLSRECCMVAGTMAMTTILKRYQIDINNIFYILKNL